MKLSLYLWDSFCIIYSQILCKDNVSGKSNHVWRNFEWKRCSDCYLFHNTHRVF